VTEPSIHIGMSRIYEELMAIQSAVTKMSCDLGALRQTAFEHREDHESRLRALEANRWPWKLIGGVVAVAALVVSILAVLMSQDDSGPPPKPPSSIRHLGT
jgi:hypothetical protein